MRWLGILVLPAMMSVGSSTADQRKPDFSGTWTLVEFRIGNAPASGQSAIVGGAAVNCGLECTIAQTPEVLTVSRAPAKDGTKPRDEVAYLDGRATLPPTTARWEGAKLVLVQSFGGPIVVTQTLSFEKERLVVVVEVATAKVGPYTQIYERK
jgi:hypothetical protein